MFRRALFAVTAAGSLTLALAGTAVADDAHQTCTSTALCSGNIVDVHDVTTTLHDVTLHQQMQHRWLYRMGAPR